MPRCDSFFHDDSLQNVRRSSAETAELVLRNKGRLEGADAVFISCTNLKSMDQLTRLEEELGPPVISSNAATLWLALRWMGAPTAQLPRGCLQDLTPDWTICSAPQRG